MPSVKEVNKTDKVILDDIYAALISCYNECSELVNNPYQNLCGLIFHELMIFYSSLNYAKMWKYDLNDSDHIFNNYPYLGYREHKNTSPGHINYASIKMKAYSSIKNIVNTNGLKVGVCHPSLNHRDLVQKLESEGFVPKFPSRPKIYLENNSQQCEIINRRMAQIEINLELPAKRRTFLSAMEASFKELSCAQQRSPKYDCLIIGTPGKFLTRIEAAVALANNKPVICIAHGNESGTADHPSWGYDDRSFCTHYLGYGRAGDVSINDGIYLHSLHGIEPKYIESNCEFIHENYHPERKIDSCLKEIAVGKFAYVPMKLMGSNRLGPFLSISDEKYTKWQEWLFELFPNIFYKAHPKQIDEVSVGNDRVVYKPLEACIHDFDGFIIDTVLSTAFANLALTNKPIIYLNIGIGKLTPYAEKLIRQRVIWIDVKSWDGLDIQNKINEGMQEEKNYNYTEEFSLSKNNSSRIDRTLQILKTINKL